MYGLNLDDIGAELFYEMELLQDGKCGHTIAIDAPTKKFAAIELCKRIQGFIEENMYECDEYGTEIE